MATNSEALGMIETKGLSVLLRRLMQWLKASVDFNRERTCWRWTCNSFSSCVMWGVVKAATDAGAAAAQRVGELIVHVIHALTEVS